MFHYENVVFPILNNFDSSDDNRLKHKLQKKIAASLKPHFFPWDVYHTLSYKAHLGSLFLSPAQIKGLIKSFSKLPLVVSAAFFKTICNALCTTSASHNCEILPRFACGKGGDDLYHFLRCSKVAFIFQLPAAFAHFHVSYFHYQNMARIAIFFEVYYILTRRYAKSAFKHDNFQCFACNTRSLAIHVAIKDEIST